MSSHYIPENNYLATNYQPIKSFNEDLCIRCEKYYKTLYDSGLTRTPFPPTCEKQIQKKLTYIDPSDFESITEYVDAAILLDPIAWAHSEFGWEPRFYQTDMLSCSAQYKLYRMGRRSGKCLIEGTLIATPLGPTPIEQLKVGDHVFDEYGNTIKVKQVFNQGIQNVVDITNNGKVYATSTLDHPWSVIDRKGDIETKPLKNIKKYDKIKRVEIELPLGSVNEPNAYVLGVLSGDGSCREDGLVISSGEEEKIKKVACLLNTTYNKAKSENYHYYLPQSNKKKINHYYEWLHNKYAHEKLVDLEVLKTWNRHSLLEYIAGLVDTDGSVYFSGKEITISLSIQAKPIIEAAKYAFLALWQVDPTITIDNRTKYKNGPVYSISVKHIYHCKRILKELSSHLTVDRKKYKKEYDLLIPNNFDPNGLGISISNPRKKQCYDIWVDSPTNLYCLANGLVTHNTEALVVEILHHLMSNANHTVLVIAPYERQVTRIFDEMNKFMSISQKVKSARYTKTPSRMEFHNGSKVLGFSAGASSSSGSDKIRGQDAHLIVIDEIDTLEDGDIDAIMAILASHKHCKLVAATTPRGWRRRFYTYVTDKNLGFKEFWFISAESPEWDEKTENFFRKSTDETTYAHEYLADFAELEEGVFKAKHINASMQNYVMKDIPISTTVDYILGVDWNKSAGTHMCILAWESNKLKLVRKIVVQESDYTQTDAVQLIISLNRQWRFKYIFVDAGYGTVQTELLRKHTLMEPSSMLDQKLYAIHMNQNIEVLDPINGEPVRRFAKPFLIEQTRKLLEDGFLILPKEEDTSASTDDKQMGLIQQMRNFRVESTSVYGLPRYSQGQDHTLTAYYLACGGFFWKEGDLKGVPYLRGAVGVEVSDTVAPDVHPSIIEKEQTERQGYKLTHTTGKYTKAKTVSSRELPKGIQRRGLNGLGNQPRNPLSRKGNTNYRRGSF